MLITVIVAGGAFELEADISEGLEVLKNQIFSLTEMLVEDMIIEVEGVGRVMEEQDLAGVLREGAKVYVKKEVKELPGGWEDSCSRIYVDDEVMQPAFKSGGLVVCGGCVTLCRNEEENEMDIHSGPFRCQCLTRNERCLFACRRDEWYSTALQANVKSKLLDDCHSSWKQYFSPGIQEFSQTLRRLRHISHRLDDPDLQQAALSCLPKDLSESEDRGKTQGFLAILAAWFKKEFFRWQNPPLCVTCGNVTRMTGQTPPSDDELRGLAKTVEIYSCGFGHQHRLPRYYDPEKLLEARVGRSEEWAVAFGAVARACGFDVRLVTDGMDGMWNEVWVGRWVHCDAAEGRVDEPLYYESNQGRKLAYALSVCKSGAKDVTLRYTSLAPSIPSLRNRVPEPWLASHLTTLTAKLRTSLSPEELRQIETRDEEETACLRKRGEDRGNADRKDEEKMVEVEEAKTEAQGEAMELATPTPEDTVPPPQGPASPLQSDIPPHQDPAPLLQDPVSPPQDLISAPKDVIPASHIEESKETHPSSPSKADPPLPPASPSIPTPSATKEAFKQSLEAAFKQLTKGCGDPQCRNPLCFSNPTVQHCQATQAAKLALTLLREGKFSFCPGIRPSI